jgi:hypothetical protein
MTSAVVMQPYFAPYAGYFRLFELADFFVVLDTAQFPRRGWVHRNRFRDREGRLRWMTLPLERCPRETSIADLRFAGDAIARIRDQARRFPALAPVAAGRADLGGVRVETGGWVSDYAVRVLERCCATLGINAEVLRASEMENGRRSSGEGRILEILGEIGADVYYNPPGGRELYSVERFASRGIELRFLPDYEGDFASILERLATEDPRQIRTEILANLPRAAAFPMEGP